MVSSDNPKKEVTGFAIQAAKDPLIAKTNKIANIAQLLSIPQRCFSFSILVAVFSLSLQSQWSVAVCSHSGQWQWSVAVFS